MLRVVPYQEAHLPAAATLFTARLHRLRGRVPALPAVFTRRALATEKLASVLTPGTALVALDGDDLVGYLGWRIYPSFRGAPRSGAHSPEFANAAGPTRSPDVYRALYRVAAQRWAAAGCAVHALTCLAGDAGLERALFEQGFGMLLHDALRSLAPIVAGRPRGMTVRRATASDVAALAELEVEHRRHYAAPPVLMMPPEPDSAAVIRGLITDAPNGIWLAEGDGRPQGFLRFEPASFGAVEISLAPTTISVTGAYVRPDWRDRGAATAMLAAAVDDYRAHGFERMAVDYETINPEALAFWPRFFAPVAISYMRMPERVQS